MRKSKKQDKGISGVGLSVAKVVFALIIGAGMCASSEAYSYSSDEISEYIENKDITKVVEVYNETIYGKDSLEKKYDGQIEGLVQDITAAWSEGSSTSEAAIDALSELQKIDNGDISMSVTENIEFIKIEEQGNELYASAEMKFENAEYLDAIIDLDLIDDNCSIKGEADEFIEMCEDILLAFISSPISVEEYEEYQETIDEYIDMYPSKKFIKRKKQLKEETPDFERALPIVETAKDDFNQGKCKKSFDELEAAIADDENNRFLRKSLYEEHNDYVLGIALKVDEK